MIYQVRGLHHLRLRGVNKLRLIHCVACLARSLLIFILCNNTTLKQEKARLEVRDRCVDLVMGVSESMVKNVIHITMQLYLIRYDR